MLALSMILYSWPEPLYWKVAMVSVLPPLFCRVTEVGAPELGQVNQAALFLRSFGSRKELNELLFLLAAFYS